MLLSQKVWVWSNSNNIWIHLSRMIKAVIIIISNLSNSTCRNFPNINQLRIRLTPNLNNRYNSNNCNMDLLIQIKCNNNQNKNCHINGLISQLSRSNHNYSNNKGYTINTQQLSSNKYNNNSNNFMILWNLCDNNSNKIQLKQIIITQIVCKPKIYMGLLLSHISLSITLTWITIIIIIIPWISKTNRSTWIPLKLNIGLLFSSSNNNNNKFNRCRSHLSYLRMRYILINSTSNNKLKLRQINILNSSNSSNNQQ